MTISFDFPPPIPLSPFILGVGLFQKRPLARDFVAYLRHQKLLCATVSQSPN
jgi:hypothetical protein